MSICGLDFGTSNTTLGTIEGDAPVLTALLAKEPADRPDAQALRGMLERVASEALAEDGWKRARGEAPGSSVKSPRSSRGA